MRWCVATVALLVWGSLSGCSGSSDSPVSAVVTSTVLATATATPTPTPEQAYRSEFMAIQAAYTEELATIDGLLQRSNTLSPSWRDLFKAAYERLAALEDRVTALQPPPCYAATQAALAGAARRYRAAAIAVTGSISAGRFDDSFLKVVPGLSINEGKNQASEAARLMRAAQC